MAQRELINYGNPDRRVVVANTRQIGGVDFGRQDRDWWSDLRRQPKMTLLPDDVECAKVSLQHGYEWYKEIKPEQLVNGDMLEDMTEEAHDLIWIRTFEGILPNQWKDRHQIMRDLEKAREMGFQLPTAWLTAAAVHCDNNVMEALAVSQNLRPHQLGMLLANPHFIAGNGGIFREQIIQIQKDRGMSDRDIENALTVADELIKKRELRTKTAKLDMPIDKLSD